MNTYINTSELPQAAKDILAEVGVKRSTIAVRVAEFSEMPSASYDFTRAFIGIINMDSGKYEIRHGSFGGSNPYVKTFVDDSPSDKKIPLLPNMMIVEGNEGGTNHGWASIVVHPSNVNAGLLSAPQVELTDDEKTFFRAQGYIGDYKQNILASIGRQGMIAVIESLTAQGLIKKAGKGYTLTAKGKTVRENQKLR